jgi:hypothetical protein
LPAIVFENYRIPALAVVRRLVQRECEIAQCALVVGQIVERPGTGRSVVADPGVNVVADERRRQAAEIGGAGAAGSRERDEQDSERRCYLADGTGARLHNCNILLAAPHAAAAAVVGRRRGLRFGAFIQQVAVTLDPDNRQDDDGGRFVRVGAAKPHDASLVGEFDNDAHQPSPSRLPARTPGAIRTIGVLAIKRHARLTLR